MGLAVLVILEHAQPLTGHPLIYVLASGKTLGSLAVDGFFILSGFLIVASWLRRPRVMPFLRNRILRIYPGWLAAFAACIFLVAPAGGMPSAMLTAPHYIATQGLRALVLSSPQGPGAFEDQALPFLNGSTWTVRYEFFCYLGVAALGVASLAGSKVTWAVLLLVGSIGSCLIALGVSDHLPGILHELTQHGRGVVPQSMRFLGLFSAGAMFFCCRNWIPHDARVLSLAVAVFLASLAIHPAAAALVEPLAFSYLLFWIAYSPLIRLYAFAKYGDFSYGIYLYGWPMQQLVVRYLPHGDAPIVNFLAATALAAIAGIASWHSIERPMLRLKAREP